MPSPVLAEVKKSLGPCSGGGGGEKEEDGDVCDTVGRRWSEILVFNDDHVCEHIS